jgi:cytochrome c553
MKVFLFTLALISFLSCNDVDISNDNDDTLVSASKLYSCACSSCHGTNGELRALGRSAVIGGWDINKTKSSLNGYRDNSYGGIAKHIMINRLRPLSEEHIDSLSKYISTLSGKCK